MRFIDQLNREFTLNEKPKRIISLVPSQTELLTDLGLEENIVGITHFCIHPNRIKKSKTKVGGTKNIHIDKVKELKPDIILCNKEENTQEIVQKLENEFPIHVSNIENLKQNHEMIEQYGLIFGKEKEAKEIIQKIKNENEKLNEFLKNKNKLKVSYFIWKDPWMVAGKGTFINHLLELNQLENVYADQTRYPEIQLEKLKKADLHLLSSEPYPFKNKHIKIIQPYAKNAKIKQVNGEFFSWYGSRLIQAFGYFKSMRINMEKLINPE